MRPAAIILAAGMTLVCGCGVAGVHVIDDATGWGVEGASVSITDSADCTRQVGCTDWQGDAAFVPPKDIKSVSVKRDSYRPITVPLRYEKWREMTLEIRLVPVGAEPSGFDTKVSDFDRLGK